MFACNRSAQLIYIKYLHIPYNYSWPKVTGWGHQISLEDRGTKFKQRGPGSKRPIKSGTVLLRWNTKQKTFWQVCENPHIII